VVQGVLKSTPKSFGLVKIRVNLGKICENFWKSLKIWEKMALNVVWLEKMAPNLCKITMKFFLFGCYPKRRSA